MSYGWDFAPRLRTIGLWDDVERGHHGRGGAVRRAGQIQPLASWRDLERLGQADRLVRCRGADRRADHIRALARRTDFCRASRSLARSTRTCRPAGHISTFEMDVPEPRLWWPWDHGQPDLYTLTVKAQRQGHTLDDVRESVGLREITLRRNPNSPAQAADWTVVVNGQPVYVRGANWVPADAFPARVTQDDYRAWLDLARNANLNALRVWGGGLREKQVVLRPVRPDGPARLARVSAGVRVHHALPALARLPGARRGRSARDRAAGAQSSLGVPMVRRQRIPSPSQPARRRNDAPRRSGRRRHTPLSERFPRQAATATTGGSGTGFARRRTIPRDPAQFLSEFGLQAPPNVESLERFIPAARAVAAGAKLDLSPRADGQVTALCRTFSNFKYQISNFKGVGRSLSRPANGRRRGAFRLRSSTREEENTPRRVSWSGNSTRPGRGLTGRW